MPKHTPAEDLSPLDAARFYASHHAWHVVPLHHVTGTKTRVCSCKDGASCARKGKHPFAGYNLGGKFQPIAPKGLLDATRDEGRLQDYFGAVKVPLNVGIATEPSNLCVIDVDGSVGRESLIQMERELGLNMMATGSTLQQQTQSGGLQLFYFYRGGDIKSRQAVLPGIDVRAAGGLVVVPNSEGEKGAYRWLSDVRPVPLPQPLRDFLIARQAADARGMRSPQPKEAKGELAIPPKEIHDHIIALGGAMRAWGLGEKALHDALMAVVEHHSDGDGKMVPQWVRSLVRYPAGTRRPVDVYRKIVASQARVAASANGAREDQAPSPPDAAPSADESYADEFAPLPEELFRLLPRALGDITALMEEPYERDLFLIGAMSVLSSVSSARVRLHYGSKWQATNLYFCNVSPAGGGKGKIELARRLGDPLDELLTSRSEDELALYQAEAQQAATTKGMSAPERPGFRRLFFGGDASGAAIKKALITNPNLLVFETETRTLLNALQMEWGAFGDILCKAFHGERIQIEREDGSPRIVRDACPTLCLTGTPAAFEDFVTDTEDGLFSRTLFYYFDLDPEFVDQFPSQRSDTVERLVEALSQDVPHLHERLRSREAALIVTADEAARRTLFEAGSQAMEALVASGMDRAFQANVKRAVLCAYRIAATLTLFHHFRQGADLFDMKSYAVMPGYVRAGLLMAFHLLDHALALSSIVAEGGHDRLMTRRTEFLANLPEGDFTLADAVAASAGALSRATVHRYIQHFAAHGVLVQTGDPDKHQSAWRRSFAEREAATLRFSSLINT